MLWERNRLLEIHADLGADDQGVGYVAGAAGTEDILEVGLNVQPGRELDDVCPLQDHLEILLPCRAAGLRAAQVAAELGMSALVFYVMFIVSPLRKLGQIARETFSARRSSSFYYLAVGLQASVIAYMVSSFFLSVSFNWYVFYLIGYAVCLRRLYESETGEFVVVDPLAAKQVAEEVFRERQLTVPFLLGTIWLTEGDHRPPHPAGTSPIRGPRARAPH